MTPLIMEAYINTIPLGILIFRICATAVPDSRHCKLPFHYLFSSSSSLKQTPDFVTNSYRIISDSVLWWPNTKPCSLSNTSFPGVPSKKTSGITTWPSFRQKKVRECLTEESAFLIKGTRVIGTAYSLSSCLECVYPVTMSQARREKVNTREATVARKGQDPYWLVWTLVSNLPVIFLIYILVV